MSDLSNEKRTPGYLGYKKGDEILPSYNIWIYIYTYVYMGIVHPFCSKLFLHVIFWSGLRGVYT